MRQGARRAQRRRIAAHRPACGSGVRAHHIGPSLPGGSGRGYTPALLSHIYEDVLTLRLILRFLSVQKIALPKVVS